MVKPLYLRVRDSLLAAIEDGTYAPGATIPSELELAELYGVSRPTVRQALALLAEEGVVVRRRKRGTIVADRTLESHFVEQLVGFEGQLPLVDESSQTITTKVLALRRDKATAALAKTMEIQPEDEVYMLMRLRSVDGEPQVIATSYTPADLYPGFLEHDYEHESLYAVLASLGHPIDTVERDLSVQMPAVTSAALLHITTDVPCFIFDSVGRSRTGRVVEYSHVLYRGDTNHFTVRLKTAAQP